AEVVPAFREQPERWHRAAPAEVAVALRWRAVRLRGDEVAVEDQILVACDVPAAEQVHGVLRERRAAWRVDALLDLRVHGDRVIHAAEGGLEPGQPALGGPRVDGGIGAIHGVRAARAGDPPRTAGGHGRGLLAARAEPERDRERCVDPLEAGARLTE